ncbi:MAG: HAD family hydrolase [Ruminococcaceae bacterium]|nr:HAD family hydrolase [Oscillospiraceae bacterium]
MKRQKKGHRLPIPVAEAAPEQGLTGQQVSLRVKNGWMNDFTAGAGRTEGEIIAKNVMTFFNLVFAVLAVALLLTGSSVKNMTFLIVVLCNIAIGCYQEIRAKRAVDKLTLVAAQRIHTVRDGEILLLPSDLLVRDDIVEFVSGDQICADGVLLTGSLQVNEALLTGEEDAVTKMPGDHLLSGSIVLSGKGRVRLTAVGEDSFAAKLAAAAKADPHAAKSEMMAALDKLIRWVGIALMPVGILLFSQAFFVLKDNLTASTQSTVAALVGMIPEGLYLLTSIAMAASSLKLTRDRVLVKDLNCIEALAQVDVLCVDKTGTITEPGMEVEQLIALSDEKDLEELLTAYYSGAEAENDTARAMTQRFSGSSSWVCTQRVPFTSQTKWSAAVFEGKGAYVIGAPEFILGDRYCEVRSSVEEWSKKGSRVLLVAAYSGTFEGGLDAGQLQPFGLVILSNRIRASAPDTFRYFRQQGVTVKVISGDNPLTVSQVALRSGIPGAENYVDASTLHTDEALAEAAEHCTVFGRVTPGQKKKLLMALKAAGHTVAMTGDGVNDVLALKEADCSVAMASGAQATSQVSQLVLLNSDFSAMPAIVGEGRRVINNIQRAASLFLVKNILSMGLALTCLATGKPYPFIPLHLTLISALTIGVPSFFLAMEPNYERVSGKFLPTVLRRALSGGLSGLIAVVTAQHLMGYWNIPPEHISTTCAALIGVVGLAVLGKTCKPFHLFRYLLWGTMALGLVFCFTVLAPFFDLTHGTWETTKVMLIMLVGAPVIFFLVDQALNLLERVIQKR